MVLYGSIATKYKAKKLKQLIKILLKLFAISFFLKIFLLSDLKINWCKWLLSGVSGENFDKSFLTIEKRVSKQGSQIKLMKKYGETSIFKLWDFINKYPTKKDSK